MTSGSLKLLTILVEPEIASRLAEELMAQGARGYALFPGRGKWQRGITSDGGVVSDWEGENVRIETVVPAKVADAIFAHLRAHYFPHYAIFAYTSDVAVERVERYS
jgi:nitrogen regulatory protein P-II 2